LADRRAPRDWRGRTETLAARGGPPRSVCGTSVGEPRVAGPGWPRPVRDSARRSFRGHRARVLIHATVLRGGASALHLL